MNDVSRLTPKLATTRGRVMTFIISVKSIFAVNITSDASGIRTMMLSSASVMPIEIPNPGIMRLLFFIKIPVL